jgi:hypothetical protein
MPYESCSDSSCCLTHAQAVAIPLKDQILVGIASADQGIVKFISLTKQRSIWKHSPLLVILRQWCPSPAPACPAFRIELPFDQPPSQDIDSTTHHGNEIGKASCNALKSN